MTLKRTCDVGTPSATYTLAEQTTDFGGAAANFDWRVAQISAVHGPGHWAAGEFNV